MPTTTSTDGALFIQRIASERVLIPIVGTSPLIMNKFSEKAKRQMLDAMQGKKKLKESRDPDADFEAALHRIGDDKYGFPSGGFKKTIVGAARYFGKQVKMTELRQSVFVKGVLTPSDPQILTEIVGQPEMREDVVRLGISGTDLRYRPEFWPWSAVLDVVYVTTMLTLDSVLSLVDAGGMGVGIGEWRPEKSGDNGTFAIDEKKIEVVS